MEGRVPSGQEHGVEGTICGAGPVQNIRGQSGWRVSDHVRWEGKGRACAGCGTLGGNGIAVNSEDWLHTGELITGITEKVTGTTFLTSEDGVTNTEREKTTMNPVVLH